MNIVDSQVKKKESSETVWIVVHLFFFWMILDGMIVSHFPYGPTAYFSLHNVVLRHDIKDQGTVSEAFPHLIFENFNSKLGARVSNGSEATLNV
jgi:hypothetical protein